MLARTPAAPRLMQILLTIALMVSFARAGVQAPTKRENTALAQPERMTQRLRDPRYLDEVLQTFTFCLGQDQMLDAVRQRQPALAAHAAAARSAFDKTHGEARTELERALRLHIGEKYPDLMAAAREQARIPIETQSNDPVIANEFIRVVHMRAKGQLDSPMREILFAANTRYWTRPERELVEGFATPYETTGHKKAKGATVRFSVPASWRGSEAEKPNIVQTFTSEAGKGRASVMILIHELPLPDTHRWTEQAIRKELTPETLNSLALQGSQVLDARVTMLEGIPWGQVTSEVTQERLGLHLFMRTMTFATFLNDRMITLQFTVGDQAPQSNEARSEFDRLRTTFMFIANSVTLTDRYK